LGKCLESSRTAKMPVVPGRHLYGLNRQSSEFRKSIYLLALTVSCTG
jgi:hypothetical protein